MTKRDRFIINSRKKRIPLQEIGNILGISRERVRQIEITLTGRTTMKNGKPLRPLFMCIPIPVEELRIFTKRKRESLGLPEVNYDWKSGGGRNFIREIVRTRDNHTCQKCGKKWKKGMRKFDVNHLDETQRTGSKGIIKYDKENMDKLITFCHKCHYAWHIEQGHTKTWKLGRG